MGRRHWHRFHAFGEIRNEQTWNSRQGALNPEFEDVRYALCGERLGSSEKVSTDVSEIDCPKCSTKLAKPLLAERIPPLVLHKVETEAFRSCYGVYQNDEIMAYAVFEYGFGGAWKIRGLEFSEFPQVTFARAYVRLPWGKDVIPGLGSGDYGSKEAAALASMTMVEAGLISGHSALVALYQDTRSRLDKQQRRRIAARDAKLARDEEILEGLKAMYDRRLALGLTNFEISALESAIRHGVDTPMERSNDD